MDALFSGCGDNRGSRMDTSDSVDGVRGQFFGWIWTNPLVNDGGNIPQQDSGSSSVLVNGI